MSVWEPELLPSDRFSSTVSMSVQFSPFSRHSPSQVASAGWQGPFGNCNATYPSADNCEPAGLSVTRESSWPRGVSRGKEDSRDGRDEGAEDSDLATVGKYVPALDEAGLYLGVSTTCH